MTIDATNVAFFIAIFPVVFPIVEGLVQSLIRYIESRMSPAQVAQATTLIGKAVTAVEQMYGDLPGGNQKVQAEALISQVLKEAHITVSSATIDMLLEAAVKEMKNGVMTASTKMIPAVSK